MSHQTICHDCQNKHGRTPKRWEWFCADCAQDHADRHRRETGHQIELRITTEPTMENLQRDIRTLRLTQRRNGW